MEGIDSPTQVVDTLEVVHSNESSKLVSYLETLEKDKNNPNFSNRVKFDLMILHKHWAGVEKEA